MMGSTNIPTTVFTSICLLSTWCIWKLFAHRSEISRLRKSGVPTPPWSWLCGHIIFIYQRIQRLPPSANVNLVFEDIGHDFVDDEMFLLDLWPFADPSLVVFNPEAAVQVAQKLDLPKTDKNAYMIKPITGGLTLLSTNGTEWKTWRGFFNLGFSAGAMMAHAPETVDSAIRLCDKLKIAASSGVVCLDEYISKSTFEVICKVLLGIDIASAVEEHVLARALTNIIRWHSFWDTLVLFNPLRILIQWYNGWTLDRWVTTKLKQRYERSSRPVASTHKPEAKAIMDIAMESYMANKDYKTGQPLDAHFLRMACHHVRLFLFVGSDSTSSTIVFAMHLLHKHPEALLKMRKEHDQIFGDDPNNAAALLRQDPAVLSQCKYTLAVIKETLRLFPPAATMRKGNGIPLRTQSGIPIPVSDLAIIVSHHPLHRNSCVWPRANDFVPERWVAEQGNELYPRSNAWRPFELGLRNCIGQNLALNEIKIVLIMTLRTFRIVPAYEDWDGMQVSRQSLPKRLASSLGLGLGRGPVTTYRDDRVFPTGKAGGHPSDGYPCRISLLKESDRL